MNDPEIWKDKKLNGYNLVSHFYAAAGFVIILEILRIITETILTVHILNGKVNNNGSYDLFALITVLITHLQGLVTVLAFGGMNQYFRSVVALGE